MNVLAIDTSTSRVSVAVTTESTVLGCIEHDSGRRHAELLTPSIQQLLADTGMALTDLDAVAVDMGPGGFTGLRIGFVTAKALAHVAGVRVYGVCSLDLVAHGRPGLVVSAIDARKDEVYTATFRDGVRQTEPEVVAPVVLAERLRGSGALITGDGAVRYAEAFAGLELAGDFPSSAVLGQWVAQRVSAGETDFVEDLMYVRKAYFD